MEENDSAVLIMFFSTHILSSRPEPEAVATKKQKLDVSMVLYMLFRDVFRLLHHMYY